MSNFSMNTDFSLYQMVKQQVRTWEVLDPKVLQTLTKIPRNRFVPLEYQSLAYADYNIPISPTRVMLRPKVAGKILQSLDVKTTDSVLLIGTGSGYLAACLASMTHNILCLDADEALNIKASQICDDLGLSNIKFETSEDYTLNVDQHFDVIVVSGSISKLDPQLRLQLKNGGRLFVVVGDAPLMKAKLITRVEADQFLTETLFETRLAPLVASRTERSFEF